MVPIRELYGIWELTGNLKGTRWEQRGKKSRHFECMLSKIADQMRGPKTRIIIFKDICFFKTYENFAKILDIIIIEESLQDQQ
jgi:hypothetical protein